MMQSHNADYQNHKRGERLTLFGLLAGLICFSFFFPVGYSGHEKLVHFAAHVGMSFLIATCFYLVCIVKFKLSKSHLFVWLFLLTLIIGTFYKFLEIAGEGIFHVYSFGQLLLVTGYYTSMSENLAGSLSVALLINYMYLYKDTLLRRMVRMEV